MHHPGSGEDENEERSLPEGVTEEQVDSLIREFLAATEKIGLYGSPHVAVDVDQGKVCLFMSFEIGDLAFSKRVQNPEQDKVDSQFHQIETEAVRDRFQAIKDKFSGPKDDPTP